MAIKLKTNNGNLEFKQSGQIIQGIDGGYYIPTVDAEGNLTWYATQSDMEPVAASNIKGPEGKQGIPGKDGIDGKQGPQGIQGIQGIPGKDGAQGPEGKQGKQGIPGADGKDGEKGESGVYVGTTEPTDDEMLIWINPEGGASEALVTKEYVDEAIANIEVPGADLTGYATEQFVNEAIAAALGEIENGSY